MTRFEAQTRNLSQMDPRPQNKQKFNSPDKMGRLHILKKKFNKLSYFAFILNILIEDKDIHDWS